MYDNGLSHRSKWISDHRRLQWCAYTVTDGSLTHIHTQCCTESLYFRRVLFTFNNNLIT